MLGCTLVLQAIVIGHASRPDLSDNRLVRFLDDGKTNNFANKGKAATEKMAAQQGREATDEEFGERCYSEVISIRSWKEQRLPYRRGSKALAEYMASRLLREKVDDHYRPLKCINVTEARTRRPDCPDSALKKEENPMLLSIG